MDPYTEKELIDCLKAISITLNNINRRLEELTLAVRELSLEEDDNFDDSGEEIGV